MDQRRNDEAESVSHPPRSPSQHRCERSCTGVQQRREDGEMSHAKDTFTVDQEKPISHSLGPHMVEVMKICSSKFWDSTNFSWLFSREPPECLDTDPADWSGVKLILQKIKYKEVQTRLSQAKAELETIRSEVSDSDSESTDSCDYSTVRIVSSQGIQGNLKSCFKARVALRTNIIKMVIVGSIDIELYPLGKDEIDWKNIPVSIERFEVNGKYIRDISLKEMRVRKVCELGLDLCTNNDKGDSMVTSLSRIQLCELYNKKLQSQIVEGTLEKSTKSLKSKSPRRQERSELSGKRSESLLSEKTGTQIIARCKSTKQLGNDHSISTTTTERNSGKDERRTAVVAHCRNDVSGRGSDTVKHIACNVNMANESGNKYSGESFTRKSSLGNIVDFGELSTDYLLEEEIPENSKGTNENIKLISSGTSDNQQEKSTDKEGNNKVSLSVSLQSLDELLDDALESQAELDRRRAHTFSSTDSNSKPNCTLRNERANSKMSLLSIQQKTRENCSEGPLKRVSPETDYDSLFGLNKFDKIDDNTGWKPAINVYDSRENCINNVASDASFTEECRHYTNYREGCQSHSAWMEQRKLKEQNYPMHGLSSLGNHLQARQRTEKDLRPAKSWSNLSISSLLSTADRNDLNNSGSESSDSFTESSDRTSDERSSSDSNSCDNIQTHSVELLVYPGRNKFLNFINGKFSSFCKKIRSFNCCSNSSA